VNLLTIAEVARRTSLSPLTIRRAIARGELAHVRIVRRVLVREADLIAFVEARTYASPAAVRL
jgi:excisionase family DNA binding protein